MTSVVEVPDQSKPRAHLSGVWARTVVQGFESLGLDAAALSEELGLPPRIWEDPAARVPRDLLERLWRAAVRQTDDRFLALSMGQSWEPRTNHLVFLLVTSAETLGEGLEAAVRYQQLLSHADVLGLSQEEGAHLVEIKRVEDQLPILAHEIEFIAVVLSKLCAFATGGAFRMRELRFEHAYRGNIEQYEALFQAPVVFGKAKSALVLDEETWNLTLPHGNQALHAQLEGVAAAQHATLDTHVLVDSVREKSRTLLPKGQCNIEAVASAMHLTPRTLQRRLHEEGTSFREVLDAVRRSIVRDGVERNQTIAEIGRYAGFTNPRSFRRALKRWKFSEPPSDLGS